MIILFLDCLLVVYQKTLINILEAQDFFFEYDIKSLNDINHILNPKYQTMTYYGVEKETIVSFIEDLKVNAFDRVVPVGTALEIELIWDGYDMIRSLTRKVIIN